MNSLDRVLGVIYKETSYVDYINSSLRNVSYNRKKTNDLSYLYNLNKDSYKVGSRVAQTEFIERLKKTYRNKYPFDYSDDELDVLFSWTSSNRNDNNKPPGLVFNKITHREYSGLDLIEFIVGKYIFRDEGIPSVPFSNLLEWDGFVTKIDYNVFYASFMEMNSIDKNDIANHHLFIGHDAKDIKGILKRGISENHMHLKGSGYNVDLNWFSFLLESFTNTTIYSECLKDKLYSRTDEELADINLAFAKLRIMHFYIWSLKNKGINFNSRFNIDVFDILEILSWNEEEFRRLSFIKSRGSKEKVIEQLKFWQRDFIKAYENMSTPMAPIIVQRWCYSNIFESKNCESSELIYIFNAYIMGVTQFKFSLLQDNNSLGFTAFKNYEDVKSSFLQKSKYMKGRNDLDTILYETVFDRYYRDEMVHQIEFRVTPLTERKLVQLVKKLDTINEAVYKKHQEIRGVKFNRELIKYGIVCHYIKFNNEITPNVVTMRNAEYLNKLEKEFNAMKSIYDKKNNKRIYNKSSRIYNRRALNAKSVSMDYYISKLVGVDAANYELNCRPYLLSNVFNGHKKLNRNKSDLGFTFHVGEDFNTLLNGLRAIDEVIEFNNFTRGDRLGHAIALGLDVQKYFNFKRKKVHTTLEDWLDDLVWMNNFLIANGDYKFIPYIEKQFEMCKEELLPKQYHNVTIHDYFRSYQERGKRLITKVPFTSNYVENPNDLIHVYYRNIELKTNSLKKSVIEVDDTYIECVKRVQGKLREKVINRGLEIETNPSSNFKISYLRKRFDLPLFSFNHGGVGDKARENISVSINTDDSAIFQTNLSMEYSLVAATLHKEGVHFDVILDYLDSIRKNSIMQSFVK